MRYSRPGFRFLSVTKAFLHCTNGSTPGGPHECSNGQDFAVESCTPGVGAHSSCNIGTGADPTCVGGSSVGDECVLGGTP